MKKRFKIISLFVNIGLLVATPVQSLAQGEQQTSGMLSQPMAWLKAKADWGRARAAELKREHLLKKLMNWYRETQELRARQAAGTATPQERKLLKQRMKQIKKGLAILGISLAVLAAIVATTGFVLWKRKQGISQSAFTIEQANMSPEKWQTNLLNTAVKGDVATLEALIAASKGSVVKDINGADSEGWTALMLACKKGHIAAVRLLLKNGARTNVYDKLKGLSPLMLASDSGHVEIVKLLTQPLYNTPLNATDKWGRTAFMLACEGGKINVIKELLKLDVNVNETDNYNTTPLIWAVMGARDEVVELLLRKGADVSIKSDNVRGEKGTALEIAQKLEQEKGRAEREPYTNMVALLKEAAPKKN